MRGSVGGKARDHAGPKRCLAVVGEQVRFALENINEFILPRVPVMQRRSGARRQTGQIGSEIAQAEEVAEWTFVPSGHTRGERIVGAFAARRSLACKQGGRSVMACLRRSLDGLSAQLARNKVDVNLDATQST